MDDEKKMTPEQLRQQMQDERAGKGYGVPTDPEELKKIIYEADKRKEWTMVKELRKRGWTVRRLPDKQVQTLIHCLKCSATFEMFREQGYGGTFSYCPFCGGLVKEPDGKVNVVREVLEGGDNVS